MNHTNRARLHYYCERAKKCALLCWGRSTASVRERIQTIQGLHNTWCGSSTSKIDHQMHYFSFNNPLYYLFVRSCIEKACAQYGISRSHQPFPFWAHLYVVYCIKASVCVEFGICSKPKKRSKYGREGQSICISGVIKTETNHEEKLINQSRHWW